ncbi:MAG: Hpt domain-containing protein [Nannocystaceae bacterium]|nr:Hpt domain-containing protein [Nannocystaceae bacterium]
MSTHHTSNWERRAAAAEKTAELLKRKVVSLYQGGSQSIISKQLERSKQREASNQQRRELLEVRQQEMARYTEVLEGQVQERTRAIRTILDNVTFGFLLVDRQLKIGPGFTKSCASLFGREFEGGAELTTLLETDERGSVTLEILIDQVFEDLLPEDVSLEQVPTRFEVGERVLNLESKAVRAEDGTVESLLMSISDVTALEEAQRQAQRNGAIIEILSRKAAFSRFVADTRLGLEEAAEDDDPVFVRRALHTVKGNAASWGLCDVASVVHDVEEKDEIRSADIDRVHAEMERFLESTQGAVGVSYREDAEAACEVERSKVRELRDLVTKVRDPEGGKQLRQWAATITQCPAVDLMGPLETFVERLALRLDKDVQLTVLGGDTLIDPDSMGPVFRNLTHLLRNSVDHGIEFPDERGKKARCGNIELEITSTDDSFEVTVTDDGCGINVDKLVDKAVSTNVVTEQRLAEMTRAQKLELIFHDGLSSADETTEISGRGVGMAAIRSAARTQGGHIEVLSKDGRGTQIVVSVPKPRELCAAA